MSQWFGRGTPVPADVLARAALPRRERALARASTDDGTWLLGTRDALVVVDPTSPALRIPWERVEAADWDRDQDQLRVTEVGEFGHERPVHVFSVPDPGPLPAMIRERVTASVLLQRRLVVSGNSGLTVIARRPPRGRGEISWAWEFDAGVDPDDPLVREVAAQGLRAAQEEIGAGPDPV